LKNFLRQIFTGAFQALAAVFVIFFIGYAIEFFGKKITLLLMSFPNLISWILIYFSTNVYNLYSARAISGITAGGILRIVPIFTGEIAESHVRGEKILILIFKFKKFVKFQAHSVLFCPSF
jgi:MFS family permease